MAGELLLRVVEAVIFVDVDRGRRQKATATSQVRRPSGCRGQVAHGPSQACDMSWAVASKNGGDLETLSWDLAAQQTWIDFSQAQCKLILADHHLHKPDIIDTHLILASPSRIHQRSAFYSLIP